MFWIVVAGSTYGILYRLNPSTIQQPTSFIQAKLLNRQAIALTPHDERIPNQF
jgi:hypothetical protein